MKSIPDAYSVKGKRIFMAHGCRIHRHWIPSAGADHEVTPCSYLPLSTTPADRNFSGNSYSSLEAKFESLKEEVLNRYKDEVEHIEVMHQCHFEGEMNTSRDHDS